MFEQGGLDLRKLYQSLRVLTNYCSMIAVSIYELRFNSQFPIAQFKQRFLLQYSFFN